MALLPLQRPVWTALSSGLRPSHFPIPRGPSPALSIVVAGRRWAAVKAQGAYKLKPRKTHPKKYGAKRSGDQYVVPGNIIFKQKGTKWWPGENTHMGRDHTIHAAATGYVKYYRDPSLHSGRQYIGVTFRREDSLPYPNHAARKRKLNMSMQAMPPPKDEPEPGQIGASGIPERVLQRVGRRPDQVRMLKLQDNYSYREDNYALGTLVSTLGEMRKKGYRSRRLALRMRRIKKERRHLRLRTQRRDDAREFKDGRKGALRTRMIMLWRRNERNQKKAYKAFIAEGKTREEAQKLAGPKIEYDPIYFAKIQLLGSDNYGKNRGAAKKVVKQARIWEEETLQAEAEKLVENRAARRRLAVGRKAAREKAAGGALSPKAAQTPMAKPSKTETISSEAKYSPANAEIVKPAADARNSMQSLRKAEVPKSTEPINGEKLPKAKQPATKQDAPVERKEPRHDTKDLNANKTDRESKK